ncbi:MAG: S-methyl-5-thioribose-1-phosphate isomerase [Spirochaetia bacterium]|nr:S-methyl-5-thioribose-1-phosphate isomerase [Spirochaetia bacterium]
MKSINPKIVPIKMKRDKLLLLNQILLPMKTEWIECTDEVQTAHSIKVMHVRGAPAIGVAAAYGFYLGARKLVNSGKKPTVAAMQKIKERLDQSRPTAVNLFWATGVMLEKATKLIESGIEPAQFIIKLYNDAVAIHEDDAKRCMDMSVIGADFIEKLIKNKKYRIMTHCNAGALATGGIGTAVGLIRVLHDRGKVEMVYSNETRPYLQGARLTSYELEKENIPGTLVVDSMAAVLMKKKMIDFIIVGADRISKNGDVANKIGTYGLSVLAKEHKIPFFVIAPESTFDANIKSGDDIPIEERSEKEVFECQGIRHAAKVKALNYSFDVTPNTNITAIFFEGRVMKK